MARVPTEWSRSQYVRPYLDSHSQCEVCSRPAVDIHHRIDRRHGGNDEWRNLQALCRSCHSRITAYRMHAIRPSARKLIIDPVTGIYRKYGNSRTGRKTP